MNWKTHCAAAVLITCGSFANAADPDGNYAIRGAGALSCTAFSEAATGNAESVDSFIRWFEGYLSATNRMLPDTYDASPFVEMRDASLIVLNICASDPEISFESAVAIVLDALRPIRDTEQSEIVTAEHDGASVSLRMNTMMRIQEALSEEGLYTSDIDGLYGPGTRAAILSYQEANGLEQTGVPDRQTIVRILAQ